MNHTGILALYLRNLIKHLGINCILPDEQAVRSLCPCPSLGWVDDPGSSAGRPIVSKATVTNLIYILRETLFITEGSTSVIAKG